MPQVAFCYIKEDESMSDISGLSNYVMSKSVTESYKSQKLEVNTKSKSAKADSSLSVKYEQSSYSSAAVYTKSYGPTNAEGYDRYGRKADGAEGSTEKATALQIKNSTGKSSIPQITNMEGYGKVIGEPKLSEAGQKYYSELKKKFGNMDFVLVSQDMKAAAHANAASYGNPNRMVVLIDDEKLERMATDESFRKKYEGIIAMAQNGSQKLQAVAQKNPGIRKIGINTLDNGAGSFMAAVAKNNTEASKALEKRRALKAKEKKAEAKKAEKHREKKLEEKRREERIHERHDAAHPDKNRDDIHEELRSKSVWEESDFSEYKNDDYEIIYADSPEELADKLEAYSKNTGSGRLNEHGNYADFKA
jgi:hypothetical protein